MSDIFMEPSSLVPISSGLVHACGMECAQDAKLVEAGSLDPFYPLCYACFKEVQEWPERNTRFNIASYLAFRYSRQLELGSFDAYVNQAMSNLSKASSAFRPLSEEVHVFRNSPASYDAYRDPWIDEVSSWVLAAWNTEALEKLHPSSSGRDRESVAISWAMAKINDIDPIGEMASRFRTTLGESAFELIPDRFVECPPGLSARLWVEKLIDEETRSRVSSLAEKLEDFAARIRAFAPNRKEVTFVHHLPSFVGEGYFPGVANLLLPPVLPAGRFYVSKGSRLHALAIEMFTPLQIISEVPLSAAAVEVFATLLRDNPDGNLRELAETARLL